VSTALYRRYRPETFAEVIGQEHVTVPLCAALSKDRVNHAYLFSGPRGCGKTTSARILARCLNCVEGPTPTPCGECPSCRDLARGGPGSLDVVEIDAASHGGVDDARSLRERAVFAPARDRFKVFIIDEAHMVSTQGFNALLKIVEEPPPHVRFVFATTEPEKVIGTIRSRTHHYPFRLVPPERLQSYLAELCEAEEVPVGQGVLPLVVRAGAGSVRDSLSVLDQLIAGAGQEGLTYALAVSLLGYTDAALLDEVVDGLAAVDGRAVFSVLDRVVGSGLDPRRFVEDLLERLRDLLVIAAVPDGGHAVLRGLPSDQFERMKGQASRFGRSELSRAADVVNTALRQMTGATSPRLQLELLAARLLLPGSEDTERGLRARVDRIEKRIGVVASAPAPRTAAPVPAPPAQPGPGSSRDPGGSPPPPPAPPAAVSRPSARPAPAPSPQPPAARERAQGRSPDPGPSGGGPGSASRDVLASGAGTGVEPVRRLWPDVLATLRGKRRMTWTLVSEYAQVFDLESDRLVLMFDSPGRAASFGRGSHAEYVRRSLIDVIGLDVRVEAVSGDPSRMRAQGPGASSPGARQDRPAREEPAGWGPPSPPAGRAAPPRRDQPPSRAAAADQPGARRGADHPGAVRGAPGPGRRTASTGPRRLPAAADSDIPLPPEPPADEPPPEDDFDPYAGPPGPLMPQRPARRPPDGPVRGAPRPPTGTTAPADQGRPAPARPAYVPPPLVPPAPSPAPHQPCPPSAPARRFSALRASATVPRTSPEGRVDDQPSSDDPTIEESGLAGPQIVAQLLGGQVIEERDE
jgi:DNA polymerase-3 subunit gamma/tau